jgi:hypothetical protein
MGKIKEAINLIFTLILIIIAITIINIILNKIDIYSDIHVTEEQAEVCSTSKTECD